MIEIPLQPIPNQSLTVRLDDHLYNLTFKTINGAMAVDIARDNVLIESGARIVAGTPLLPYRYQESGNFLILTLNDDIPYYDQFGVTQKLIYTSQVDIGAARG